MSSSIRHFQSAVEQLFAECLPELPRASRQRLQAFVCGLLIAGSLVLRRIATSQAHLTPDTAQAASQERRLRRTLNDRHLARAVPLYGRVLRRLLRRLPPDQPLTIILDESGHTDLVRVLLAALWYRGRALPLAWIVWPAYQSHPHSYWTDCNQLLACCAALLPETATITVVADRAFGCPGFTDLVVARGWHYVVRVQGQTRLRQPDGQVVALSSLLAEPGSLWKGQGQVFKKEGWREASVVAYWRQGCTGPLLLVSSLPASWGAVLRYRQRSAIEALFRDWKQGGWQWEQSQVRDVQHQAVLVLVLALSTLLTLCLGEQAAERVLAADKQQGQRRPWQARDSLFRLGRDELWRRLWQNDTSELSWELSGAGTENWSSQCWRAARPTATLVWQSERVRGREYAREPVFA